MLISSMRPADTASTAQATASRSINTRSNSRLRALICFESLSRGSWKSAGRITAAAKNRTGQAAPSRLVATRFGQVVLKLILQHGRTKISNIPHF